MKFFALYICFSLLVPSISQGQLKDSYFIDSIVHKDLQFAVKQYRILINNIPEDKIPRSFDSTGRNIIYCKDGFDWTSGFFPGTLWYLFEYSGNPLFKKTAESKMRIFEHFKYYKGTHDLGFTMYSSFGNGYRLTHKPHFKDVLLISAGSLSSRFNPKVGCIKSWSSNDKKKFTVIIDNLMNLELLCWAAKNGGCQKYLKEAKSHADITMENHFRPDFSTWHVVDYNCNTGNAERKRTVGGYSDSSIWARGESWALYGYTMMYRETKDPAYLEQAQNIAQFILTNPNLPEDKIPYWDYDAPKIPNTYRDVSAASIMASALIELSILTNENESAIRYKNIAEKIIINLSKPQYLCTPGEYGGFILKHVVGYLPGNSEVDVPLSYADYYFVEALIRYKKYFLDE